MSTSEIIAIIIPSILLLASIFGIYLKLKIDITKVEMRINAINRELLQKEIATLLAEKINREDHKEILCRIDTLIEIYSKK